MSVRKNFIHKALTALLFIVLEVAAVLMISNNDIIHRQWIMRGVISFRAHIWGGTEGVKHYFSLGKTNDSLAAANARLMNEVTLLRNICTADSVADSEFEFISASIVKGSVNRQNNYLILNKGEKDGIRPQMGVVTDKGVIGIIDAVTANYAYVISFLSPEMSVSARLGHEGVVGRLEWNGKGSASAVLSEVPLHTDITPGDTIYTSGFSNLYPSDIPLGEVTGSNMKDGASLDVDIRLFQDFKSLKHVYIIRNKDMDEIMGLIKQNAGK